MAVLLNILIRSMNPKPYLRPRVLVHDMPSHLWRLSGHAIGPRSKTSMPFPERTFYLNIQVYEWF